MKSIEKRLPQEFDKSFIVFQETGPYFPFPWHYHPEYELVLVRKSTGRRMVGHVGNFAAGDLVFMGPMLPHVWVNDQPFIDGKMDYDADAIVLQFTNKFLGKGFLKIPEMEAFKNFLSISGRGLVIRGTARDQIIALMEEMLNMNGLMRISTLIHIFNILALNQEYELLASPVFYQKLPVQSSVKLKKINEYIMQNFREEISLNEVATMANMAVTTFCNFFKDHYRTTFVEYVNNVRIGQACNLLSEKEANIGEIAFECGYNSLANFNKQFKKIKKITPSEYRKLLNTHS